MLLTSLGMNYYLYNQGAEYYRELNATRLDPLGLSAYPLEPEPNNSTGQTRVVFFGDSRAASWPAPSSLDRFEFINRGIGAQTSAQVLQRFEYHVAPLRPHILLLQVGINDLKTLPLFPEQQAALIENCKTNIQQIVTQSTALNATVILTTIFPTGNVPIERRPFWSDEISLAVDEVNAYIQSLAADKVIVFDSYSILADAEGDIRPEYAVDTLHINSVGYDALNQELITILDMLQTNSQRPKADS